jgi:glycosyltransferase involved in cell wall biosynthesis
MIYSVVIPARNEERFLGGCLESVRRAAAAAQAEVDLIVVLNRCADATEAVARAQGARVVRDDSRNLARIRNAGARAATGEILVTIDADSRMSANMLQEIGVALRSGRYIGGGVPVRPERLSPGIALTGLLFALFIVPAGLSGGLFWCWRKDFEAIGGFDERKAIAEDLDFARRLKAYGRARHKRFVTLWRTHITTSCRKFDRFGDWFAVRVFLTRPRLFVQSLRGTNSALADRLFYDFER